jgi:hypothetical protein
VIRPPEERPPTPSGYFTFAGETTTAVDIIGGPRDFDAARKLVVAKLRLSPEALTDPDV